MTQTMVERVDWEAAERALEEDAVSSDRALATLFARHRLKAIDATGAVELREALEPFAACCDQIDDNESDDEWAKFRLLVKDYRRAKLALTQLVKGSE